jgi:hypothetical protein
LLAGDCSLNLDLHEKLDVCVEPLKAVLEPSGVHHLGSLLCGLFTAVLDNLEQLVLKILDPLVELLFCLLLLHHIAVLVDEFVVLKLEFLGDLEFAVLLDQLGDEAAFEVGQFGDAGFALLTDAFEGF